MLKKYFFLIFFGVFYFCFSAFASHENDSVNFYLNDTTSLMSFKKDSVNTNFDIPKKNLIDYDKILNHWLSKHYFADSLFVIHLEKLLSAQKIGNISPSIIYLKNSLNSNRILFNNQDSNFIGKIDTLKIMIDSLSNIWKYDSITVKLYNKLNDSILIDLKSTNNIYRIKLYDDENYSAGLWIKPEDNNSIRLLLEDGTTFDKIILRKTKTSLIPVNEPEKKIIKLDLKEIDIPIWKYSGLASLNFNQGYAKNWIQGGLSTISSLSQFKINISYLSKKVKWENDLDMRVGLLQPSENEKIRINEDRFEFNSKYGLTAFKSWYYTGSVNFKTQLFYGKEYPKNKDTSYVVSKFMAPAYIVFSLGMDYKPNQNLNIMISPVSAKLTIIIDTVMINTKKYGITAGQKVKKEIGAYFKGTNTLNISKDISVTNKLNLFLNYLNLNSLKYIDIDWEMQWLFKINNYISTSLNTRLLWDFDIKFKNEETGNQEERIQFMELLGIGFLYKF